MDLLHTTFSVFSAFYLIFYANRCENKDFRFWKILLLVAVNMVYGVIIGWENPLVGI